MSEWKGANGLRLWGLEGTASDGLAGRLAGEGWWAEIGVGRAVGVSPCDLVEEWIERVG